MNNIMHMMGRMLRAGMQPSAVFNRLIQSSDPRIAQVQRMIEGKSPEQLYQMVNNMCKERGTTPEEVARQLGFNRF